MEPKTLSVNRAPVLTLWASAVAERLGFDREASLSLGKALAGLHAQTKGRSLGIFRPSPEPEGAPRKKARLGEEFWVVLLGRPVPVKSTEHGIRAVVKDRPIEPEGVVRYLEDKFGPELQTVRSVMLALTQAFKPEQLAVKAFSLYERFRPEIPPGARGWGAKGKLDLDRIRTLANEAK